MVRQLPFQTTPGNMVVGISVGIFLLTPFLYGAGLSGIVSSMIGRLVLIGFVLYGITLGPLPGIFAFLAAAAVFAERNRFSIMRAQKMIISRGSPQTLGSVDMPHSTPASVDGNKKQEPWLQYSQEGSFLDGDGWQGPVGESEDMKHVLETQLYPNDRQDEFYVETGLAPEHPNA